MITNPHQIQALKEGIQLPVVVAQYTTLRRSGDHHVTRCVFHNEKTASMHVWPSHYICFGCSAAGDVFSFLCQVENWTFHEALSYVADRLGVTLTGKKIPRAALAHARETETFCIWWWKRWHLLLQKVKAAAYAVVEPDGEGPNWNWLEYVAHVECIINALQPSEKYGIFRASAPDKSEWRADLESARVFGVAWMSLSNVMNTTELTTEVAA